MNQTLAKKGYFVHKKVPMRLRDREGVPRDTGSRQAPSAQELSALLAGDEQAVVPIPLIVEPAPAQEPRVGAREEARDAAATVPAHHGAAQTDQRMLVDGFTGVVTKESLRVREVGVSAFGLDQVEQLLRRRIVTLGETLPEVDDFEAPRLKSGPLKRVILRLETRRDVGELVPVEWLERAVALVDTASEDANADTIVEDLGNRVADVANAENGFDVGRAADIAHERRQLSDRELLDVFQWTRHDHSPFELHIARQVFVPAAGPRAFSP